MAIDRASLCATDQAAKAQRNNWLFLFLMQRKNSALDVACWRSAVQPSAETHGFLGAARTAGQHCASTCLEKIPSASSMSSEGHSAGSSGALLTTSHTASLLSCSFSASMLAKEAQEGAHSRRDGLAAGCQGFRATETQAAQ